jgi:predicted O-linked N-acetylglucosamine transferase (SPINDLY family)
MTKDQKLLQNAFNLHRQGRLVEAGNIYELLIKRNTNNYDALHFLGTIKASFGNFTEARKLIERSLAAKHINIPYVENYATILFQNGAYERAVKICSKIIKENRSTEHLQYILAVSLYKLDCIKEAISEFDRLLLAHPNHLAGNNEKAAALAKLEMYDEALLYVDKALKINPRYAEGFLHKGNILLKLKKYDESLLAYRQALSINQNLPDVYLGYGNVLRELRHHDEAFAAYDKALALKPDFADAWLGRGNVFTDLNRYGEAFAAYDKALALKPDFADAWLGRGNVFTDLNRYGEAFAAYDKALALRPDLAEAWLGRGNVFNDLRRYDEAFAAYDKALALKPDLTNAEGARLHSKMHLCDWSNFDAETAHLISSIRSGTPTIPFSLLAISPSLRDQLQDATLWTANECPLFEKLIWQGERYDHDKIRVAYLSADFREHPMSFLMAGIFEHHDKSRFDVAGISLGPDDNSEIRQRLKATFERFIDAKTFSDEQIANLVRSSEVDILVDLMGFTAGARTGVFARRPAPVQVNYLGYPATMGAEYIDYIIGDRIVIPDDCRKFYSEKIAILPNTYQANDRKRIIADKAFTRSDVGLPPKGFVFCCFNNNYKITPRVFDSWMRILKQIEGSVIWLLELNASAAGNLKKEAVARGVSAERLVFAKRMPLPEHLARHNLADLFLDTLPYNAHTTASDALWAGLPVLTCLGETFAGRVAASLLNAIRLPELITTTLDAYEEMAIDLATHPEKLAAIKRKLAENCLTTPLFDIKLFTKHIEAAYSIMWERYQRGEPPESFSVDPLEQQLKYQ